MRGLTWVGKETHRALDRVWGRLRLTTHGHVTLCAVFLVPAYNIPPPLALVTCSHLVPVGSVVPATLTAGLGAVRPWFDSFLCQWLVVWPWPVYLIFLGLSFIIYRCKDIGLIALLEKDYLKTMPEELLVCTELDPQIHTLTLTPAAQYVTVFGDGAF